MKNHPAKNGLIMALSEHGYRPLRMFGPSVEPVTPETAKYCHALRHTSKLHNISTEMSFCLHNVLVTHYDKFGREFKRKITTYQEIRDNL